MKELFVVAELVFGQESKVFFPQADNEYIPGSNIVDFTVLRAQCPIQWQLIDLSFFVENDCRLILPWINGFNPSTNSLLQRFQIRAYLNDFGIPLRLDQENGKGFVLFHPWPP